MGLNGFKQRAWSYQIKSIYASICLRIGLFLQRFPTNFDYSRNTQPRSIWYLITNTFSTTKKEIIIYAKHHLQGRLLLQMRSQLFHLYLHCRCIPSFGSHQNPLSEYSSIELGHDGNKLSYNLVPKYNGILHGFKTIYK